MVLPELTDMSLFSTYGTGSRTPGHHGKHEGSDREDIILSQ